MCHHHHQPHHRCYSHLALLSAHARYHVIGTYPCSALLTNHSLTHQHFPTPSKIPQKPDVNSSVIAPHLDAPSFTHVPPLSGSRRIVGVFSHTLADEPSGCVLLKWLPSSSRQTPADGVRASCAPGPGSVRMLIPGCFPEVVLLPPCQSAKLPVSHQSLALGFQSPVYLSLESRTRYSPVG